MNIIITGFMGTGKTSVGKMLSERLGWSFVDVDEMIEKTEGKTISEIFKNNGEKYFRDAETKAIKAVSLLDKVVVSCGGGAVLRPENIDALERSGFIVSLSATPEIIYERTKNNTDRPLLAVKDPVSKIKELLSCRAPYYKRCDIFIDTSSLKIEDVVEQLVHSGMLRERMEKTGKSVFKL